MLPISGYLNVKGFVKINGVKTDINFSLMDGQALNAYEALMQAKSDPKNEYSLCVTGRVHIFGETININEHWSNIPLTEGCCNKN